MDGRIIKAALAGAGALALLGAGTTYASFSDSKVVEAARVSAAKFEVGAASASGASGGGTLVPGDETGVSQTFLVQNASSSPASIGVSFANLVDREDGCSADEVEVDKDCASNIGKLGDLSNQALVKAVAFPAVAGTGLAARCPAATAGTRGIPVGPKPAGPVTTDTTTTVHGAPDAVSHSSATETYVAPETSLAAFVNGPRYFDFSELAPTAAKSAVCVRVTLTLPLRDDNNAVQGDTVDFDVRLRLAQVVTAKS